MIIKGNLNCDCGETMIFETTSDSIVCMTCRKSHRSIEHGVEVQEAVPYPEAIEEPQSEVTEYGTNI